MSGQAMAVDILSDSDGDLSPLPKHLSAPARRSSAAPPSPIILLDDDPTPTKPTPSPLVALSPLASRSRPDVVLVHSSLPHPKLGGPTCRVAGFSGMILVESDDESERVVDRVAIASSPEIETLSDLDKDCDSELSGRSIAKNESTRISISLSQSDDCYGSYLNEHIYSPELEALWAYFHICPCIKKINECIYIYQKQCSSYQKTGKRFAPYK